MGFDISDFEPQCRVCLQNVFDYVSVYVTQVLRELNRARIALLDYLERTVAVFFGLEGRGAAQHFADEDSDAPDIHLIVILDAHHDLGSCIARRPAIGLGSAFFYRLHHFSESKVNEPNMALLVYENILGFQVPIDYIFVVQVFHCLHNLRQIEFYHVFGQRLPHFAVQCFE